MTTAYDIPSSVLVEKICEELKGVEKVKPPQWALYAKTGSRHTRTPDRTDWWHVRAASLMRRLYIDGPVGVERLSRFYGGKQNRGHKPEKFTEASGSVLREILQQLSEAGLVEEVRGGRKLTSKGHALVDKHAHEAKKQLEDKIPALSKY
jgi:small subunit ribosomal protein S19e